MAIGKHYDAPEGLGDLCTQFMIEHIEQITIVGPADNRTAVYDWLHQHGYRITRGGPYQDHKTYPDVDPTRFLIVATK